MSDGQAELARGGSSRRRVLAGVGAVGAATVLAGCGTDPQDDFQVPPRSQPSQDTPPETSPSAEAEADADQADAGDDEGGAGGGLAPADEIEVGGGRLVDGEDLVITHPAEGEWYGFSSICTHQGCTVSEVAGDRINCNCHGSVFSAVDGSVVNGPANRPLEAKPVVEQDGQIVYA